VTPLFSKIFQTVSVSIVNFVTVGGTIKIRERTVSEVTNKNEERASIQEQKLLFVYIQVIGPWASEPKRTLAACCPRRRHFEYTLDGTDRQTYERTDTRPLLCIFRNGQATSSYINVESRSDSCLWHDSVCCTEMRKYTIRCTTVFVTGFFHEEAFSFLDRAGQRDWAGRWGEPVCDSCTLCLFTVMDLLSLLMQRDCVISQPRLHICLA